MVLFNIVYPTRYPDRGDRDNMFMTLWHRKLTYMTADILLRL